MRPSVHHRRGDDPIGVVILSINQKMTGTRKSYTTVTGKSSQVSLVNLKQWNRPVAVLLVIIMLLIAVLPLLTFATESVIIKAGNYSLENMTLDFWIGRNLDYLDQGDSNGILLSTKVWKALGYSLALAATCAVVAGTSGMLLATPWQKAWNLFVQHRQQPGLLSLLDALFAFGAIYLAMSVRIGWLKVLYCWR